MRCCDTIFVDFSVLWLLICLDICVAAAVDLVTVAPAFDATAVAATIVSSIAAAAVTRFAFVTAAFSLFH